MFGSQVFQSWLAVIAGGILFAMLFGIVGVMSEVVMGGELNLSYNALSLSALAFVGYVGVASFIRLNRPSR